EAFRASSLPRCQVPRSRVPRGSFFRRAPPPPPPFWKQPRTWAALALTVVAALCARFLYRQSRKESKKKMSMAEMYFQLEKSALAGATSGTDKEEKAVSTKPPSTPPPPAATPPPPVTTPPPAATTTPPPPATPPPSAAKPPPPATTPPPSEEKPPPATTPPPPAAKPPPPATTPPPSAATPPPPATTPPPPAAKPPPPATTSPPSAAKPPPPATTPQPSAAKPPPPATTPPPSAAKPPPPATTPPSVAKTPPPATTPPPSAAKAPPAATTPPPSAAKPPPAATTPPPSAAKPPPPAKSPPASAEKTEAKAKPAKKEAPVPDKPKAEAGTKAETKASSKDEEKKGFGWLLNRNKAAAAPALAELLKEEDAEAKFYRAVASELCVDTPGIFDGTEGLTAVPSSVPMATRATLLHAAVKAEAEKLAPKEAAEGTVCVAKSMVREMVEKAADIKDSKAKREALDKVVLLAHSSQSLATALAPNVEAGVPVYEGSLRYKTLESLFDLYLDNAVEDMQQSTAAMFGSLMGGEDASNKTMAELTARAEQAEKAQNTLAGIFKISEGKAQKLLERKMKAATDQAQKDMMSGLMGGNS
ncbi:unnamed protein product, partial [Effrenium voratum]